MKFLWQLIRRPFCKHRNTSLRGMCRPTGKPGKFKVTQAKWCTDCLNTLPLTDTEKLLGDAMKNLTAAHECVLLIQAQIAREARDAHS